MIKHFKLFEAEDKAKSKVTPIMGMVGLPSGEYIEITLNQFNDLNQAHLIDYNSKLQSMTFDDSDYDNIMYYIRDTHKDFIKSFLTKVGISNYKINNDYSVDVMQDVKIRMPMDNLPVQFDYVMGDFDISSCGLINLQGCPEVVEKDFICTNNRLSDLRMGPTTVGGNYDVRQCSLGSLKGAPEKIKKNFIASQNNLPDLIGGPRIVDGSYYVDNCLLVSLEGSPEVLAGDFDCSFNLLDDLKYGPNGISGTYDCSNNDIKTLKDGPSLVGVFKCNGNRKLRDLHLAPPLCKIISDEL